MPVNNNFDRLDLQIGLERNLVKEVLPYYFRTDYPNLITFLEGYYEFLESEDEFGALIHDLYQIRDIETNNLKFLDNMFKEYAFGLSQSFFTNPRESIRNFARFFRVKGTKYSAEGFFRAFFDEEVEVEYPKNSLFILNESEIGVDSRKILQDGAAYQVLSVLIKAPLSFQTWEELYRKFVHPTGFFLSNEVVIVASQSNPISAGPTTINESDGHILITDQFTNLVTTIYTDPTILANMGSVAYRRDIEGNYITYNDSYGYFRFQESDTSYTDLDAGSNQVFVARLDPDQTVRIYKDFSIPYLETKYSSIYNWIQETSHTLDNTMIERRNPSSGDFHAIDLSSTLEEISQDLYDSNFTGAFGS